MVYVLLNHVDLVMPHVKAVSHLASQGLRCDDRKPCDRFKPYDKYQIF